MFEEQGLIGVVCFSQWLVRSPLCPDSLGGSKEFIPILTRVGVTAGIDGLFIKVHPTNQNELKADFPSADYITNNRFVFNIKGNSFRIVVILIYFAGELNIRFAGTHAEYDKIDAKTVQCKIPWKPKKFWIIKSGQ